MPETHHLIALIAQEGEWYAALCPELDIASQGETIEEAKAMLSEAVELFLETASKKEIEERLHTDVYITPLEVTVG
ncbi:MAG TPA: type II toxin-antitoxin system HicB family antitoxin [Candidatus Hydrogenedentes bacterium]|nr:type II toxin-antitoxin system HicB family antitoxin [Candidatus Hydrogenedentota bacterium]